MLAFLSFSRGTAALLTSAGRGHKEQDFTAGHHGAEPARQTSSVFPAAMVIAPCSFGLCSLGCEMGVVK